MTSASPSTRGPASSSVVLVEPTTAYFPPPHRTRSIRNTINVSSTSEALLVFKVRSSNPERFIVKPTAGFIAPTSVSRLYVTLKRTDDDLSSVQKKDRFRVTVKRVSAAVNASKDDAKKTWEDATDVVLETDIWCHYGSDVPANVALTFLADESVSEVGGVTPSVIGGSAPMNANTRVSFGDGGSRPHSTSAAANHNSSLSDAKSVKEALLNAQRIKESIQTDVASLKAKEKSLQEQIALGNAKSDSLAREALELEELRTKVKRTRELLSEKGFEVEGAQAAQAAADEKRSSAAQHNANTAAALAAATKATVPTSGTAATASTAAAPGSLGAPMVRPSASSAPSSSSSMYLSTVLVWMLLAYVAGMLYRVHLYNGLPSDIALLLPPEVREAVRSILHFMRSNLF